MHTSKKLLSLLLALVMVCTMVIPVLAAEEEAAPAPYTVPADVSGKVVILHTNDVHGGIAGYAKVAALKEQFKAAGANVLVLDAGDFIQGDPVVSVSSGATAIELMNLVGYNAEIGRAHV